MSELAKQLKTTTAPVDLDGFDGHTDECAYERGDQDQDQFTSGRVIHGRRINFTKVGTWIDDSKQLLPSTLQLIVFDMIRVVQKWGPDNMPAEPPHILEPDEKWPDVDAMNERCPKTEWRTYYDKLIGPYQRQKIVYLWDPVTMTKYSWPTSSNSGMACVSDLAEQITMMRRFKKVKAVPVVKLGSRPWSKRYGTPGPDLIVLYWFKKAENGDLLAITDQAAIPAAKPLSAKDALDAFAGVARVDPPTAKEATDDEIKF